MILVSENCAFWTEVLRNLVEANSSCGHFDFQSWVCPLFILFSCSCRSFVHWSYGSKNWLFSNSSGLLFLDMVKSLPRYSREFKSNWVHEKVKTSAELFVALVQMYCVCSRWTNRDKSSRNLCSKYQPLQSTGTRCTSQNTPNLSDKMDKG